MDPDFRQVKKPAPVAVETKLPVTETPTPEVEATPQPAVVPNFEPKPRTFDVPKDIHKKKLSLRERALDIFHTHKREWLASTLIVLVCGSLVGLVLIKTDKKPTVAAEKPVKKVQKVAPQPTVVPSTLTGLPVAPDVNKQPVTGVMIENSLQARPQSGLSQAGVVFEAIAEGGITRFLALYQDTAPENVGPIRSARPYYAQWALGFDAGYAHVGGSPQALQNIKDWGVRDLDQFHNSGSYHRIASRAAPHNVYTSINTLKALEAAKGYTSSTYTGFERKKEAAAAAPTAKAINMFVSGAYYNVHYDYNPATNSYNRSEGGQPHLDAETKAQISPKVVIALVIPYSLEADGYHSNYASIGSGAAYIFQDGTLTKGTWTKTDNKSQITFTDAGKPIKLNPGQTWLTAVKAEANVTFTP